MLKHSKAQVSNLIQSSGNFGFWLDNLGKAALNYVAILLARDNLPGLVRK